MRLSAALKRVFPGLRFSWAPTKQMRYLLLWRHVSRLSRGKQTGMDFGCGRMDNRPMFRTKVYLGLDFDEDRLKAGKEKYPDAFVCVANIANFHKYFPCCDVGLCVQVFNHKHFDPSKILDAISDITSKILPGGSLIFNLNERNLRYKFCIEDLARESFEKVKRIKYGRMGPGSWYGPLLGLAMFLVPPLRTLRGNRKILYICEGRRRDEHHTQSN